MQREGMSRERTNLGLERKEVRERESLKEIKGGGVGGWFRVEQAAHDIAKA